MLSQGLGLLGYSYVKASPTTSSFLSALGIGNTRLFEIDLIYHRLDI